MAFVRHEMRRGRVVYRVVESRRVRGKKYPRLVTLAYLGEDPDVEMNCAVARMTVRLHRETVDEARRLREAREGDAQLVARFEAKMEAALTAALVRHERLQAARDRLMSRQRRRA